MRALPRASPRGETDSFSPQMPRTVPASSLAKLDPPQLRRSPKMVDISTFVSDPAAPARATHDRAAALVASLERATAIVKRSAGESTSFGNLSLVLFDKAIRELDNVVLLVEEAATAGAHGEREPLPGRAEEDGLARRSSAMDERAVHEVEQAAAEHGDERTRRSRRDQGEWDGRDERDERDGSERRHGRRRHEPRDGTFGQLAAAGESQRCDDRYGQGRPPQIDDGRRSTSSLTRRDDSLPHDRARLDIIGSRRSSAAPSPPTSSAQEPPIVKSRSASRATSRAFSPPPPSAPPPDEPAPLARRHGGRKASRAAPGQPAGSPSPTPSARAYDSASGRPKSRAGSAASRRDDQERHDLRSDLHGVHSSRPKSRSSTGTASLSRASPVEPLPPRRPSSRSRFVADSSASDDDEPVRRSVVEESDDVPATRARSRSKARSAARSHSGRSDDARRALELASAPPPPSTGSDSGDEVQATRSSSAAPKRRPPVLGGARTAAAIVRAVAEGAAGQGNRELRALSLVSREYCEVARPALYRVVALSSRRGLELLLRSLESNPALGALVDALKIQPLDADLPTPSPDSLVGPLGRLLDGLPNLTSLDEDFTAGDWDVGDLSTGHDYPLTVSSPSKNLVRFRSAKAWFEIGALFALLQSQPHLVELVIGGAAMDRDWAGTKLLAALSSSSSPSSPPGARLERLEVAQVMHEDTLAVLLRATGGSSSGRLSSVRIGFQSLGTSDDDTPLASVPAALALVGSSLTHLALAAPRKASDDSSALLDEVVAVLPRLEVLEWTEATDLAPVSLATAPVLGRLPSSLRVLRARSLVSLSTSAVLSFLHGDAPRALQVLDIQWAADDLANEPWFKVRHIARIEDAAAELGIACHVGRGDEALAFRSNV